MKKHINSISYINKITEENMVLWNAMIVPIDKNGNKDKPLNPFHHH